MSDDLADAGITAGQRLTSIEEILKEIVVKLDGKADRSTVVALEYRVRELELAQAKADAAERVVNIERAANAVKAEKRQDDQDDAIEQQGRKIAWASGAMAALIVASNTLPFFIK